MIRVFILAAMAAAAIGCGQAAVTTVEPVASAPPAAGPRWVVLEADGLSCTTCAACLQDELEQVAGLSQIETFAPNPYCRFYVEDGSLDVARLLNGLPDAE